MTTAPRSRAFASATVLAIGLVPSLRGGPLGAGQLGSGGLAVACSSAASRSRAVTRSGAVAFSTPALSALLALAALPPLPAAATANPLANPATNRPLPALATSTGECTIGQSGTMHCQSPCYPAGRFTYNASPACTDLVLGAINQAQAAEHRPGFTLPSNYFGMSAGEQMFVLVNLERMSRGVPPLVGLSPYLDSASQSAARGSLDPAFQPSYGPVKVWLPPGGGLYAFGGAWSGNSVNAAAAVFGWFYDDGWGGKGRTWNFACTSPTSAGCWGHRDELLGEWAGTGCTDCVAGVGYSSPAAHGWLESYDFLEVRPLTFPTPLAFSWDGNVLPHLPPGWEHRRAP